HAGGGGVRWRALRERWVLPGGGGTLALLVIWPAGFLFPSTVPFGQGVSWERLQAGFFDLLSDHPPPLYFDWLWAGMGEDGQALSVPAEGLAVAIGLLCPCLLAFSVVRRGWRRVAIVVLAAAAGFGTNSLSAALNFGPEHAFGWLTPTVPIG